MTTKLDNRINWKYKGCEIIPVACYRDANWGKEAEPIDFGFGMRSRYWRIEFPDKTWVHSATKSDCRKYIDKRSTKEDAVDQLIRWGQRVREEQTGPEIVSKEKT